MYLGKLTCRSELGRYPLSIGTKTFLKSYLLHTEPWSRLSSLKGQTIRKVMGVEGGGGMGKRPKKKFMQGKRPRKKIIQRRRERKNSGRRKVQLSLFQKVWVSFGKSEFQKSTILPGTIWINKNHFLFYWKETIRTLFLFQIAASVLTTYTVYWIIIKIIK